MKPRDVKHKRDHDRLKRDYKCVSEGWIMVDGASGTVTVCKQRVGEHDASMTVLSRRAFNALIDWYNADQGALKRPHRR